MEPTGIEPEHALLVYAAESRLNPAAANRAAWGLPQAQAPLLRALGWQDEPSAFARLTVAQQAPWIRRILESQIRDIGYTPASALELYTANFSPLAAREKRWVIYSRDDPSQTDFYNSNRNLDREKKGYITTGDLDRVLHHVEKLGIYKRTLEQLRRLR